jgi:hypothetical protein
MCLQFVSLGFECANLSSVIFSCVRDARKDVVWDLSTHLLSQHESRSLCLSMPI